MTANSVLLVGHCLSKEHELKKSSDMNAGSTSCSQPKIIDFPEKIEFQT